MKKVVIFLLIIAATVMFSGCTANEVKSNNVSQKDTENEVKSNNVSQIGTEKWKEYAKIDEVIYSINFNPNGKEFITTNEKTLKLWDTESMISKKTLLSLNSSNNDRMNGTSVYSSDGKLIACGVDTDEEGPFVLVINSQTGETIAKLFPKAKGTRASGVADSLSFSIDNKFIAMGSLEKLIRIWDIESKKEIAFIKTNDDGINLTYSHDGRYIAYYGTSKNVTILKADSREIVKDFKGDTNFICAPSTLQYSHDDKFIANSCGEIWNVETGALIRRFETESGPYIYNSLSLSPDGKYVASAFSKVRITNIENGEKSELPLTGNLKGANYIEVKFSPDGQILAVKSRSITVFYKFIK